MDDLERFKVLLYQYFIFNSDRYKHRVKQAQENLRHRTILTSRDIYDILYLQIQYEAFQKIDKEIFDLLNL